MVSLVSLIPTCWTMASRKLCVQDMGLIKKNELHRMSLYQPFKLISGILTQLNLANLAKYIIFSTQQSFSSPLKFIRFYTKITFTWVTWEFNNLVEKYSIWSINHLVSVSLCLCWSFSTKDYTFPIKGCTRIVIILRFLLIFLLMLLLPTLRLNV